MVVCETICGRRHRQTDKTFLIDNVCSLRDIFLILLVSCAFHACMWMVAIWTEINHLSVCVAAANTY